MSAATASVHCREGFEMIRKNQSSGAGHGIGYITGRSGRFPQELAVRGIAKVEIEMSPASGDEVRASRDGLRLKRLDGCAR